MPTIDELRAQRLRNIRQIYWIARGRRLRQRKSRSYSETILNLNPIALWPLNETSGTTINCLVDSNQDGTYTGVELDNSTGADGQPVGLWDGVNDVADVYSSTFSTAFDGTEGALSILLKVFDASVWTDSTLRYGLRFRGNSSNHIRVAKTAANNTMLFEYRGGGVTSGYEHTISTTDWIHVVLTWSDAADEFKTYVDGSVASTLTSIGTWGVSSLESTRTVLGALDNTPSSNIWYGWMQHAAVWTTPLSADNVSEIYGAI